MQQQHRTLEHVCMSISLLIQCDVWQRRGAVKAVAPCHTFAMHWTRCAGGLRRMSAPAGPRREVSSVTSDILRSTMQAQTRAMARKSKESASRESVRKLMREDCARLGINDLDAELPPVVHVAGTKGKGSTCALLESILSRGNLRTGLFTSPHLVDVRERLRVNGRLLSPETFDELVLDTYNRLGPERMETIGFFQFLTLMTFRAFAKSNPKRQEIDVLILETGLGGRLDFTNAIDKPLCCAITRLDLDHVDLLGDTIPKIAAEKAGILKPGVCVFTSSAQVKEGLDMIVNTCKAVGSPLEIVPPLESEPQSGIGIGGKTPQLENASLALAMARQVFASLRPSALNDETIFLEGLAYCRFPGRAQVETNRSGLRFYLDGAHTPTSVEYAAKWFQAQTSPGEKNALVFHCSADRDAKTLLAVIHQILPELKTAYFVNPSSGVVYAPAGYHENLASVWRSLDSQHVAEVIKDAAVFKAIVEHERQQNKLDNVFVVGSFYIVGDALKLWLDDWNVEEAFRH